jgi:hypothetical protein
LSITVTVISLGSAVTRVTFGSIALLLLTVLLAVALLLLTILLTVSLLLLRIALSVLLAVALLLLTVLLTVSLLLLGIALSVLLTIAITRLTLAVGPVILCHAGVPSRIILAKSSSRSGQGHYHDRTRCNTPFHYSSPPFPARRRLVQAWGNMDNKCF